MGNAVAPMKMGTIYRNLNLVFMQFEQRDGKRTDLPKPSIAGMGLERIGALLQGKHDNYDTDLIQHIIAASADFSDQAAVVCIR